MHASDKGTIGGVEISNRIVMAPMISNLANVDGSTNETHMAYLEERARGGAGLIITEYTYVDDINSRGSRNQLGMYSGNMIPKLRRLTERVHGHGTKIFMQLVHAGGKASPQINGVEPIAPSAVDYMGHTPREMTEEDIERVVQSFTDAAIFAKQSRFDGIELHGAHGYLLQEFMSPGLNKRTDKYGGSVTNRLRISQEIIDRVKEKVDMPVGIRLSLYEDDVDGYGPDYGVKLADSLKDLDYVHFSAGRFAPPGSSASFYDDRTTILNRLPRKPGVATMVVGSITSREDVERALKKVDFVTVARGMLADPYFAWKIQNDHPTLRPCIRCNQGCRDLSFGEVRCTINPDTGREMLRTTERHDGESIVIVGAGVKGLEAAVTAAKMGMKVQLHEKRESIGGQLLDITDDMKKIEFTRLLDYYRELLKRLGVEIHLGSNFSGDALYCLPDVAYPDIEGGDEISIDSNVYKYHDMALKLAERKRVIMSKRSLSSMDRARYIRYVRRAEELGIEFSDHKGRDFDLVLFEENQYELSKAMISGKNALMEHLHTSMNMHL